MEPTRFPLLVSNIRLSTTSSLFGKLNQYRMDQGILSIEPFFSFRNIGKHVFRANSEYIDRYIIIYINPSTLSRCCHLKSTLKKTRSTFQTCRTARFVRFAGVMSYKVLMRISNASRHRFMGRSMKQIANQ